MLANLAETQLNIIPFPGKYDIIPKLIFLNPKFEAEVHSTLIISKDEYSNVLPLSKHHGIIIMPSNFTGRNEITKPNDMIMEKVKQVEINIKKAQIGN